MVLLQKLRNWVQISSIQAYLGDILRFNAILLLLPVPVALYFHEPVRLFILASLASYVVGWFFHSKEKHELKLGEAMLLTITTLFMISCFSSIVYLSVFTSPLSERVVDSFFESISGYTTTGLSVINPVELNSLPRSVVFLRAVSQWIGGVGIIVMFILVASYRDFNIPLIYKSERGGRRYTPAVIQMQRSF